MNNKFNKTIREQRKEAVVNAFFKTVKKMSATNPYVTNKEVLAKAVNEEAPRFFVNYESARRFISLMARRKKLPVVNKNKRAMYDEIYRRYKERCKGERGHYKMLEKILEEPAPSFYIDESTFQGIIYRTLRERNLQPCA